MSRRTDRRRGLGVSNDVADADEVLKTWDKDRLLKLLELRKNQGFDSDVKILESVIKNLNKKSVEK